MKQTCAEIIRIFRIFLDKLQTLLDSRTCLRGCIANLVLDTMGCAASNAVSAVPNDQTQPGQLVPAVPNDQTQPGQLIKEWVFSPPCPSNKAGLKSCQSFDLPEIVGLRILSFFWNA